MAGLVLKDVSKRFDGTKVLQNVSLELEAGELLVLLGPSGCGKSTLLRIIAGLEEGDSGEVHIDGKRVDRLRPRDRNVALVFQNYSLYPHMTVEKNLAFPLKVAKVKKTEIDERVQGVADMLGLGTRLKDRPGQLSGGQRQRVALGRAIIREPSIFLLDEPLSNLDADLRVRMRQEIVGIQRKLNKTMVHVTHDQTEALSMADRIALLNEGHIEQIGTPKDLYNRPASLFVARFIGLPKINVIEVEIDGDRLIPFGTLVLEHIAEAAGGEKCTVGLRPESISIAGDGDYHGRVESCEYLGDHYEVAVKYQDHLLTATSISAAPEAGKEIRFSIDKSAMLYFDSVTGRNLSLED